ncbi:MAG: choice-of-anchor Q domain-containing protein, partial [Anaerolineales bacterium]
ATPYGPTAFIITTTVTIQGNGATLEHQPPAGELRFFLVAAPGSLTLASLTLRHGRVQGAAGANGASLADPGGQGGVAQGGAIFNINGVLTLDGVNFIDNVVQGGPGGHGFNASPTSGSTGGDGGGASGAAIYSAGPFSLVGAGSTFIGNQAYGGAGGQHGNPLARGGVGGLAFGGGFVAGPASVGISATLTALNNAVIGGAGPGGGGQAGGGAIVLDDSTAVVMAGALFQGNRAEGGSVTPHLSLEPAAGGSAIGGAIYGLGRLTLNDSRVVSNTALGGSGPGAGYAYSGGLYLPESSGADFLVLRRTSLLGNLSQGGNGSAPTGRAGGAAAGGLYAGAMPVRIMASDIVGNRVVSGTNPATTTVPLAVGGGLFFADDTVLITNTTIALNVATTGGGVYNSYLTTPKSITLTHVTIYSNTATTAGGLFAESEIWLRNSIVSQNAGGNCTGFIQVQGDNLQYPGSACTGATQANPLLGTLADHGGDTLTVDLLANSPAIGLAAAAFCPQVDQRGVPRPLGAACDLGAYERWGELFLPLLLR